MLWAIEASPTAFRLIWKRPDTGRIYTQYHFRPAILANITRHREPPGTFHEDDKNVLIYVDSCLSGFFVNPFAACFFPGGF
jgi:hypothetical protein